MSFLDYAQQMRQMLPPGRLWKTVGSWVDGLLEGAAMELQRISDRLQALYWETDPRYADELMPEFEEDYGVTAEGTLAERRARVVARELAEPRVRPLDFQTALAPLLGQATEDVVVIERSSAQALAMGDEAEIFDFFIYRDPSEPGSYDLDAAQGLVDDMAHSHTKGYVIESIAFACDDEFSLCDRDILGV